MNIEEKPKILIVGQENLTRAGIQHVIMSIVRSLHDEYTFDVTLLRNEKKDYDDEFLSYGGQIFHCPTYQGKNRILLKADYYIRGDKLCNYIRKIIRENGPYIAMHCHASLESAVFLKAAYKEGIPVRLVHSHGVHDAKNENIMARIMHRKYVSWIHKYATKCLGDSENANITHYGKNHEAYVVTPSYDESAFNPDLYPISREGDRLVLTQVGQYCPNKNQIFTINVFSEIHKIYPNSHLNFVGFDSTGFLEKMKAEIEKLNLDEYISFYPHDANIPKLLSQSDAFLFPSYTEGFGIAAVEAQAMGSRCYASDTVPHTTDCGGCTFLSLSASPDKWAKRIVDDYTRNPEPQVYDCSKYKTAELMKKYKCLYEGKE